MKILFTGGGTGGHIVPIIAITREIRRTYPAPLKNKDDGVYQKEDPQFFYIGPKDEFGSVLLSQEGIKVKQVLAGKIRRYHDWKSFFQNLLDVCFKIPLGILQSFFYIFFLSPDLIFSKGGFGSIPGVIAGKLLLVPIFLHESDIAPGMASKFVSRFALEVFVSFPRTEYFPLKKMVLVGNPIRREVLEGSKEEAKNFFKLSPDKPVILILGGSQGAQRINDEILEILSELLKSFEVIHQCGENNFAQVKAEAKVMIGSPSRVTAKGEEENLFSSPSQTLPDKSWENKELEKFYHLFPFLKEPELRQALAAADLILSRAGSGSIFEIAAAGKPAILIPLPEAAQNHQVKNAYAYQESGACIVIEEANFTSHFFLERLKSLFSGQKELEKMQKAAREFAKPKAAKMLAEYIVSYLTK